MIADASPVGLGAVLVQEKNGDSRAVCYARKEPQPGGKKVQPDGGRGVCVCVGIRALQPVPVQASDIRSSD